MFCAFPLGCSHLSAEFTSTTWHELRTHQFQTFWILFDLLCWVWEGGLSCALLGGGRAARRLALSLQFCALASRVGVSHITCAGLGGSGQVRIEPVLYWFHARALAWGGRGSTATHVKCHLHGEGEGGFPGHASATTSGAMTKNIRQFTNIYGNLGKYNKI